MSLTHGEPEACVTQVGVEYFTSDTGLHGHVKVLRVQIQHLVHLPETETHTTLQHTMFQTKNEIIKNVIEA